jgi:predicted sugar kinase
MNDKIRKIKRIVEEAEDEEWQEKQNSWKSRWYGLTKEEREFKEKQLYKSKEEVGKILEEIGKIQKECGFPWFNENFRKPMIEKINTVALEN